MFSGYFASLRIIFRFAKPYAIINYLVFLVGSGLARDHDSVRGQVRDAPVPLVFHPAGLPPDPILLHREQRVQPGTV